MRHLIILLAFLGSSFFLQAQTPIIFIYDASGSMWGALENSTKIEIARNVLGKTAQNLPAEQSIGLVAYGHRREKDCSDVEFLVSMDNQDKSKLVGAIQSIRPLGRTPLAASASMVFEDLKSKGQTATVILITDGVESCGGDLCAVVRKAKEAGITFRLHIVGFGLKEAETEALKCAAEAGDGAYYDAQDSEDLTDVLEDATQSTVEELAKNFSLFATKNGKAVDAMGQFYRTGTNEFVASVRTYADTGFVHVAPGTYDLAVRALEGSDVGEIRVPNVPVLVDQMTHRDISFDAGKITIETTNNGEGWDATVTIYDAATKQRVASGRTYGRPTDFEVNPGSYEALIKALQLNGTAIEKRLMKIEVAGGETTIARHNFQSGTLSIGANNASGLVDATIYIKDLETGANVAQGRTYTSASSNPKVFQMNPGRYEISLKALGKNAGQTARLTVVVKAGESVEKMHRF